MKVLIIGIFLTILGAFAQEVPPLEPVPDLEANDLPLEVAEPPIPELEIFSAATPDLGVEIEDRACSDKHGGCPKWAGWNLCSSSRYPWIGRDCKKSCGKCSGGSGTCGRVSSDQDAEVLRNAYRDLKKVNGITVDCNLEKAAQSVKQCVWNHSQHRGANKLVNGAWKAVISCAQRGGCSRSYIKNDPLRVFRAFKHKTGHWNNIMSSRRAGCSTYKYGSSKVCFWCYLQ